MATLEHLEDRTVLVTGGTRGLGRTIGREFAAAGARVVLTHKWGTTDEAELVDEWRHLGLGAPLIVQSDSGDPDAVRDLMTQIRSAYGRLDVIVSGVSLAKIVHGLDDLRIGAFELSMRYSAWPIVEMVQAAHEVFGRYPGYVIGISSAGAEQCLSGYELAGAAKSVLESLCRYLALQLKPHGVRINAVRPGFLDTDSSRATFGDAAIDKLAEKGLVLSLEGAARACVALCSGLLDAVTGQVLVVDEGWSLVSPLGFVIDQLPGPFPAEPNEPGPR